MAKGKNWSAYVTDSYYNDAKIDMAKSEARDILKEVDTLNKETSGFKLFAQGKGDNFDDEKAKKVFEDQCKRLESACNNVLRAIGHGRSNVL